MKKFICCFLVLLLVSACAQQSKVQQSNPNNNTSVKITKPTDVSGEKEKNNRIKKGLTLAQLHYKYPTDFFFSGPRSKRAVALTFDDVPDPRFTPQVLDLLRKYGVKATFFCVGNRAKQHPELVKQMIQEGHEIGNHTYTHPNLPKVNNDQVHDEIQKTEKVLFSIVGYKPKLFRPPYGNIEEAQLQWLVSEGYKTIHWDVDSKDWKDLHATQIKANILKHTHSGSIILQHAGGGESESDYLKETIKALPDVLQTLKSKGFKLVTVSELLNIPNKK
ncbi:MAG TPA: polysaccharide deacetylase family protein [Bacillota bacterium]|nr:polysaccharide deacetylase family protein [Bacillota bacterium]